MSAASVPVSICIIVDETGDYIVADDPRIASDIANSEFGEDTPRRYVNLKLKVRLPNGDEQASQTFEIDLTQT
jgi:hypothetical protein